MRGWVYGILVRRITANMLFVGGRQKTGVLSMGTGVKVKYCKTHYKAEATSGVYDGGKFIMYTWDVHNYWKED